MPQRLIHYTRDSNEGGTYGYYNGQQGGSDDAVNLRNLTSLVYTVPEIDQKISQINQTTTTLQRDTQNTWDYGTNTRAMAQSLITESENRIRDEVIASINNLSPRILADPVLQAIKEAVISELNRKIDQLKTELTQKIDQLREDLSARN